MPRLRPPLPCCALPPPAAPSPPLPAAPLAPPPAEEGGRWEGRLHLRPQEDPGRRREAAGGGGAWGWAWGAGALRWGQGLPSCWGVWRVASRCAAPLPLHCCATPPPDAPLPPSSCSWAMASGATSRPSWTTQTASTWRSERGGRPPAAGMGPGAAWGGRTLSASPRRPLPPDICSMQRPGLPLIHSPQCCRPPPTPSPPPAPPRFVSKLEDLDIPWFLEPLYNPRDAGELVGGRAGLEGSARVGGGRAWRLGMVCG
jgi:hypothetical protein